MAAATSASTAAAPAGVVDSKVLKIGSPVYGSTVPIEVELRGESGPSDIIERLPDVHLTATELPAYEDSKYPYLRLIDPYGDTIFSRYQMVAILPELERLAAERPSRSIEEVVRLARRCARDAHSYLVFVGD